MKNKKASHVGFVLSFVIFVTFLVFLFSILGSPIKFSRNNSPLLDYLEIEFENRFISNLTKLTITSPINHNKNCIKIDNQDLELTDLNAVVKDVNNIIIHSKILSQDLLFDWAEENDYFKIYYSEDLNLGEDDVGDDCYNLQNSNIKSIKEDYYFSKKKIESFFEDYEEDYENLKVELNLPISNEFGLSFTDSNKAVIKETGDKEVTTDVYAREIPIQYFTQTAEINSGFINIKVW